MWFKVDDGLAFHRKTLRAGNAAMGLWVRAGAYCGQHMTDGFIDAQVALTLGTAAQVHRLVDSGLWIESDEGYLFHDWADMNPTRAEIETARKKEAARKKIWRETRVTEQSNFQEDAGQGQVSRVSPTGVPPSVPRDETRDTGSGRVIGSSKNLKVGEGNSRSRSATEDDPDFTAFWDAYPRKTAKGQARTAWRTALHRAPAAAIVAAAAAFAVTVRGRDSRYIPHPATWLNGERWADDEQQELPWWETE